MTVALTLHWWYLPVVLFVLAVVFWWMAGRRHPLDGLWWFMAAVSCLGAGGAALVVGLWLT